jgi:DNA (cytosine-5)-methyltransferase 1
VGPNGLVEWSVLDAQWFGVAQRRRRVFALLDFGDWAGRPPILLEPESLRGDSAPSREAGQGFARVAGTLASSGGGLTRPAGNANELGDEVGFTLRASSGGGDKPHVLCPTVAQPVRTNPRNNSDGGMEARQHIYWGAQVRRLTPIECERLQGFPDGFTQISWRGKPAELCPDGPRYKALGNSMCTNVVRWIGQAIERAVKSSTKGKAK